MADPKMASADDFEAAEEVTGSEASTPHPAKNACKFGGYAADGFVSSEPQVSELMAPKPKADFPSRQTTFYGRDGLGAYTADPTQYPQSRVVYYNDNFVVINDLFPKSVVHMLILPRDPVKSIMHPTAAFDDPAFLALCREEEKNVRKIAASELQRQFGRFSASDRARIEAMDSDDPPDVLPAGRDWESEVNSGIHANPSMNHLHIHVLSRDMHSEKMKKFNHYLSFTTDFFARMDEFPLAASDHRRMYKLFPEDMVCWRCGKSFGRKFAELKRHLDEEFDQWKKE